MSASMPPESPANGVRTRRSLLAAALGGLAGWMASSLGRPSAAHAAAGDPLIMGSTTNSAGTSNTSLATNSSGTALFVTQNGSGTAFRGSAVGAGSIAGFFTAANGPGISGVTGVGSSYGVYGGNDGPAGTAGAIRANGGNNHGLVATTGNGARQAVRGVSTDAADNAVGVYGESAGGAGAAGVKGVATNATGGIVPTGVYGTAARGDGVWGYAANTGNEAFNGVTGETEGQPGAGVYGAAYNANGTNFGVYALAYGATGRAVYAEANASGVNYGVYALTTSASGYGLWSQGRAHVQGDLSVSGSVSKSGGSFRIDHPLDPAHKFLAHSFIESPDMKNVYDGVVTLDPRGEATVELPDYFEALNRTFRYQLTAIGSPAPELHVKTPVSNGRFSIAGGQPGQDVSWQVTGIRRDRWAEANRIVVEEAKTGAERGAYLHPALYGRPEQDGIDWLHRTPRHELPRARAR